MSACTSKIVLFVRIVYTAAAAALWMGTPTDASDMIQARTREKPFIINSSQRYQQHTINDDENTNSNQQHLALDMDGTAIAQQIRQEVQQQVTEIKQNNDNHVQGQIPGLAVILVGSRRDSQAYVNMKKKACAECGIQSYETTYTTNVTQHELLHKIKELNDDPRIHGILVQLPLPSHLNESVILNAIAPEKDVDGLHPINVAALAATSTRMSSAFLNDDNENAVKPDWKQLQSIPFNIPCTPQGCIELLDRCNVEISGKRAVVIGRSNLVGLPVAMLLMHRDATVSIVHSKTQDPQSIIQQADIVIVAIGKAMAVPGSWFKPNAVVVDVGINFIDAPDTPKGYELVGDVNYQEARKVVHQITPVPGGVGPMTIAILLRNTVNACQRANKKL